MPVTTTSATGPAAAQAPCPDWCSGRHGRPAGLTTDETPRYWHIASYCPPWCTGHLSHQPSAEHAHISGDTQVKLSLAEKAEFFGYSEKQPDFLAVRIWQEPASSAEPTISVHHGGTDEYLPDMTPGEAAQFGAALIQAAGKLLGTAAKNEAKTPQHKDGTCPPWCKPGLHGRGVDMHMSEDACRVQSSSTHSCGCKRSGYPQYCPQVTCAQLVQERDAHVPFVELYHGDDMVPPLSLDAARQLAVHLQELARVASQDQAHGLGDAGCPWAWCAREPGCTDGVTGLHMSEGRGVPVASPLHYCGYTTGPMRRSPACTEDVSAWIVRGGEDSETHIVLHHGDDCLPEMPLSAARDLASAILGLVQQARDT